MNVDDFDFGSDFDFDFEDLPQEKPYYPDFFLKWDRAIKNKQNPGYFESEEIMDIIEIYALEDKIAQAWQAIDYALNLYSEDEDMVYHILDTFTDLKLWSDLLKMADKYKTKADFLICRSKIDALLHLGMEEDAFQSFKEAKALFANDNDALYTLYYTMGEGLFDMNLYEAAIYVVQEGIDILEEDIELYWLQIDSYAQLKDTENLIALSEKITSSFPFDADVWHKIAFGYYDAGEYERAIEAFEFADNLDITDHRSNLSGMIRAYEKNGNTDMALEKVKEFLYLYPEKYSVNLLAASLSADLGEWDQAIKFLNEMIKKEPNKQAYYLYKSTYYLNMGEYKKAKLTLEEGISKSKKANNQLIEQLNKLNNQYPDM